jgi:hypothetical protein
MQHKTLTHTFLLVSYLSLLLSACHKKSNDSPPPVPAPGPDVYMIGNDGSTGTIWKNGTATALGDQTYPSDFTILGKDIYICGDYNSKSNNIARYWKNGVAVDLSDGTRYATAFDLFVIGNDIYVGGREQMPGNAAYSQAKYWKNGTPVILTGSNESGTVYGIVVVGNDVYAIGEHSHSLGSPVACYWKNGQVTDLTDKNVYAAGETMTVSGNDIYMVWSVVDQAGNVQTRYSKNFGTPVLLTNGPINDNTISILNNDVYITGTGKKSNVLYATYWKNGMPTYVSNEAQGAFATGIAIAGSDIYLSGWTQNVPAGKAPTACYWKNGEEILLANGAEQSAAKKILIINK